MGIQRFRIPFIALRAAGAYSFVHQLIIYRMVTMAKINFMRSQVQGSTIEVAWQD
jgi:hypothetical protein